MQELCLEGLIIEILRNITEIPNGKRNAPEIALERFAIKIWWQGYRSMRLRDVKPKLRTMSSFEEAPDIIVGVMI